MGKTEGDVKSRNPFFGPEFGEAGFPVVVQSCNEAQLLIIKLDPRRWRDTGTLRNEWPTSRFSLCIFLDSCSRIIFRSPV